MKYKKPKKLNKGDIVAVLSPSWGGPGVFPEPYETGLKVLKEWGLNIKEYPTTRASADFLAKNPEARARDINDAFADTEVKAIFVSIGGDDSVRILPFLDKEVIKNNPKILMGYSDTTTLLIYCNQLGIVTFNGPAIMAGFSQTKSLPESFESHIKDMLFNAKEEYIYKPYAEYSEGYPNWGESKNVGKINPLKKADGWKFVQGSDVVRGELFGGCIEVLEFMKGTDFWPEKDFWKNKILFFETSEDKPAISNVKYMLRNYGSQGIFDKVSAVLFGRARDYSDEEKIELDNIIKSVISEEFGRKDLAIVTNMDFGHTDPQAIMPLGVKAEINFDNKSFKLVESWLE